MTSCMVATVPFLLGPTLFFMDYFSDGEVSVPVASLATTCLFWPLFAMFQHEKAQEGVADIASMDGRSHYSTERL